jgi:predicted DNA-binding antitoxin AbrB/MazE fold protein
MQMSDSTWHMVKATPKVTGFVGSAKNPRDVPSISDVEVARLTSQISEGTLKPKARVQFEDGDQVRVIDGPFSNFNGTVEEVKPDKGKLRVPRRSSSISCRWRRPSTSSQDGARPPSRRHRVGGRRQRPLDHAGLREIPLPGRKP